MSTSLATQIEHAHERARRRFTACAEGLLRLEAQRVSVTRLLTHAQAQVESDGEASEAWERFQEDLEEDRQSLDVLYHEFQMGQSSAVRIMKQAAQGRGTRGKLELLDSLEGFLRSRQAILAEVFAEGQERLEHCRALERTLRDGTSS